MLRHASFAVTALVSLFAVGCADAPEENTSSESEVVQCQAMPACDAGDPEVSLATCSVSSTCYVRSMCGKSVACLKAPVSPPPVCMAFPACPSNEAEVESAEACKVAQQSGIDCKAHTMCGHTIWCAPPAPVQPPPPAVCLAFPSCDAGDVEHAAQSECLQDVGCYKRTMCGRSIWCSDVN